MLKKMMEIRYFEEKVVDSVCPGAVPAATSISARRVAVVLHDRR